MSKLAVQYLREAKKERVVQWDDIPNSVQKKIGSLETEYENIESQLDSAEDAKEKRELQAELKRLRAAIDKLEDPYTTYE